MKKILVSLMILALCVPAMAITVTLSEPNPGDGVLRVSYALDGGETNIRGLALVCTTDTGDAVIDETTDVSGLAFNTYVDYAMAGGYTIGTGHPIADPTQAGTLDPSGGIGTFALSMGYLDQGGAQAGLVDSFFDITYTLTVESTVTVTVDALRGGIVGDDVGAVTITGGDVDADTITLHVEDDPCPGDVTDTHTGYIPPAPPLFEPGFDINLWNGASGQTNSVDLQAIILLLNADDDFSIADIPAAAEAADVTATHTGYIPPAPPLFEPGFDMGLWNGADGTLDSVDLQALILLLNQDVGFLYDCP